MSINNSRVAAIQEYLRELRKPGERDAIIQQNINWRGMICSESSLGSLPGGQRRGSANASLQVYCDHVVEERKKTEKMFRKIGEQAFKAMEEQLKDLLKERNRLLDKLKGLKEKGKRIQGRIDAIQERIDAAEDRLPKTADGKIDWAKAGEEHGIEKRNGESDEAFAKRAQEEMHEKWKRGELDSNSPWAMWFAAQQEMAAEKKAQAENDREIEKTKNDVEDLDEKISTDIEILKNSTTPEQQKEIADRLNAQGKEGLNIKNGMSADLASTSKEAVADLRRLVGLEEQEVQDLQITDEAAGNGNARNKDIKITADLDDILSLEGGDLALPIPQKNSAAETHSVGINPIVQKVAAPLKLDFNPSAEGVEQAPARKPLTGNNMDLDKVTINV